MQVPYREYAALAVAIILLAAPWHCEASPFTKLAGLFKRKPDEVGEVQKPAATLNTGRRWLRRSRRGEKNATTSNDETAFQSPFMDPNLNDMIYFDADSFKMPHELPVNDYHAQQTTLASNHHNNNDKRESVMQVFLIMAKGLPPKEHHVEGHDASKQEHVFQGKLETAEKTAVEGTAIDISPEWYMSQLTKAMSAIMALANQQRQRQQQHRYNPHRSFDTVEGSPPGFGYVQR